MKKIIVIHPTGNQNVRNLLRSLYTLGILKAFYTSVAVFKGQFLYKLSKFNFFKDFKRRIYDEEIVNITNIHPWKELGRIICEKLKMHKLTIHETGSFSIDSMYRDMDLSVSKKLKKHNNADYDSVYMYEDCGINIQKIAKAKNWNIIYELPTGYWRASKEIFEKNRNEMPLWSESFIGLQDSDSKLRGKDIELSNANHIVVASTFVANTLQMFPNKLSQIHIVPYGFPEPYFDREYISTNNRKLKLFYIGRLTQQKGIGNLFEAVDELSEFVELTIVGKITKDIPILNDYLNKHIYIPSLSHSEILELMRTQDIMIFPSLFEGFGLVITESMSQGTPVITTVNTCGPDFINNGENGWIVPFGDTRSLVRQIRYLLDHPNEIAKNGKAALSTASSRPWKKYEEELANLIYTLN